jgi:hypothetical protein
MPKTTEELEKEIKRLEIKLETLVNFLQVSHLGPPSGRAPYDARVKEALKKEGL